MYLKTGKQQQQQQQKTQKTQQQPFPAHQAFSALVYLQSQSARGAVGSRAGRDAAVTLGKAEGLRWLPWPQGCSDMGTENLLRWCWELQQGGGWEVAPACKTHRQKRQQRVSVTFCVAS